MVDNADKKPIELEGFAKTVDAWHKNQWIKGVDKQAIAKVLGQIAPPAKEEDDDVDASS